MPEFDFHCEGAAGNYRLDLCLALHAEDGIELTVINPCLARPSPTR
jgi:hypothetical protein